MQKKASKKQVGIAVKSTILLVQMETWMKTQSDTSGSVRARKDPDVIDEITSANTGQVDNFVGTDENLDDKTIRSMVRNYYLSLHRVI